MSREFTFHLSHNVGKSATKGSFRFALSGVLIDGACAVASDGKQLVCVPVKPVWIDNREPVEGPELVAAEACKGKTKRGLQVTVNGRCESKGRVFERPSGRFPNWRDVVPEFEGADTDATREVAFALTPDVIRALLDGMTENGDELVTFVAKVRNDGKRVVNDGIGCYSSSGAIGVIMPAAIENAEKAAMAFNAMARDFKSDSKHDSMNQYNDPYYTPADAEAAALARDAEAAA